MSRRVRIPFRYPFTVIGTPPASPTVNNGPVDLPELNAPDLVNVTLDLSGSQGDGWIRITPGTP